MEAVEEKAVSPVLAAIDKEVHTEYESFFHPDYSFNVEVPKGMNDNDYRDYTFRLNNNITPDERVKYYNKNIPYGEGEAIASRKKEAEGGFWENLWPSASNAAVYAATGVVRGFNTLSRTVGAMAAIDDAFHEEFYKTHDKNVSQDEYNKAKIEWIKKNKNIIDKSEREAVLVTPDEDSISAGIERTIEGAQFELEPQKRWSAGWWGQGVGNVAAPLSVGLMGGIIPELSIAYGMGNYAENTKKVLEGGGSLMEANAIGLTTGSLEAYLERLTINKYVTNTALPRLQRYGARFLTGMGQEFGQSGKDILLLGKYDTRTKEEKEEELLSSLVFGGLGEVAGLGVRDYATRKVRKDINTKAQKEGMSEQLAKEVALSATLDEKPDFEKLQGEYAKEQEKQAEERFNARKEEAYDMLVELGNSPEMAAAKISSVLNDFQTEKSQVIEDLENGTYMTEEQKQRLIADYEEAINKGGEDASKLLQLREIITNNAIKLGLSEDEYLPAAKVHSIVALKTWKMYNEINGMSFEDFLNGKGVAGYELKEFIDDVNKPIEFEGGATDEQIKQAIIDRQNEIKDKYGIETEGGKLFSPMTNSKFNTFKEYYENVRENKSNPQKEQFNIVTKGGVPLRVIHDVVNHDYNNHVLSVEEWETLFRNIDKVEFGARSQKKPKFSGTPVVFKVKAKDKYYGVALELFENKNPIITTAFIDKEGNIDNWIKNEISPSGTKHLPFLGTNLKDIIYDVFPNFKQNVIKDAKLYSKAPEASDIEKEWKDTFGNIPVEQVREGQIINDFEKETYQKKIDSGMSEKQAILETINESIARDSAKLNTEDTLSQNNNNVTENEQKIVNEVNPKPVVRNKRATNNQGAYTPVSRIIEIAKEHTPDTFLHEVSHNFFINYFDAVERISDKNSSYYKQAKPFYDYLKQKTGKERLSELTQAEFNDFSEFVTQSFVKYLHTGDAPSAGMQDVFDRAKRWTISIYHDVVAENPVSEEVKGFFDNLLTEDNNLNGINELHDRLGDVIRIVHGAKQGKENTIGGRDKQDIDLLLRAIHARQPRKGKTLAQELRQDGGINADSELAKTLGYDPKKKNPIFKKNGRFDKMDEIEDYLRDKGIYNFKDAETAEEVAKKEDDIINIIENADMTYSQNERYQEDLREVVARNQAEASAVLGKIMDKEGLKNLNEVEDLLLKARAQMNVKGRDVVAVNKNAIKYIESAMWQAKKDLGRMMRQEGNDRYNYQQKLKDMIRGLPISYKNKDKLIGNIARVTNKETFNKVASQVLERAEEYAKAEEKQLHRDNIKTMLSGTYQKGAKNKKFTYEGNKLFEELRDINKLTQEQAREALFDRIEQKTGYNEEGVLTSSEILARRMLQYKGEGVDMSLDNIKELDFDISAMIENDIKSRAEFDEMKSAITKKNVEDLANKIETLDKSKTPLLVLSIKNGDFYSIMNEIGGKEFADKFNMRVPFAKQEIYLQERLNSAIKQGADIYGLTANKFIDKVQELSEKKYTLTPKDNYGEDKISKMEIMHIMLGMRQKDTRDLILNAYEEFDENGVQLTNQIGDLISNLDVKDIQFASMLQREIGKDYEEENKAYIFRNGVDMPHLENYFPRKSRRGNVSEDSADAYTNLALQVPSFYKTRGKNAIPVFSNVWTVFKMHKADASYAINVFPQYLEIYKVLNNPKIQHLLKNKYGDKIVGDINSMVKGMGAKSYNEIYSSMNNLLSKIAGNWVKAKIGVNAAIFTKQLISVTNYAENMPVFDYIKNMAHAARHPKEAYDFMQDVAGDFINTRFKLGRQNEILSRQLATTDETKKGILKASTAQSIDDAITLAVRTGDIAPIIYGGYARVKYLMEQGKTKEQAREIFIDETLRSQQASSAPTTSNFQKQGGLVKFLTAFQNTPYQYARILAEAQTMHRRGEITDMQFCKTLLNYMVVQPFLLALAANGFYNLFHDDDKDKDLISIRDIGMGAATSWLGGVPMLTDMTQSAFQALSGEQPYGINIGIFADFTKSFQKLRKSEKDNWDWAEIMIPFVEAATGKPLGVVERYAKRIIE